MIDECVLFDDIINYCEEHDIKHVTNRDINAIYLNFEIETHVKNYIKDVIEKYTKCHKSNVIIQKKEITYKSNPDISTIIVPIEKLEEFIVKKFIDESELNVFNWNIKETPIKTNSLINQIFTMFTEMYLGEEFIYHSIKCELIIKDIIEKHFNVENPPKFDWDRVIVDWKRDIHNSADSEYFCIEETPIYMFISKYIDSNAYYNESEAKELTEKYTPIFMEKYKVPTNYTETIIELMNKIINIEYGV